MRRMSIDLMEELDKLEKDAKDANDRLVNHRISGIRTLLQRHQSMDESETVTHELARRRSSLLNPNMAFAEEEDEEQEDDDTSSDGADPKFDMRRLSRNLDNEVQALRAICSGSHDRLLKQRLSGCEQVLARQQEIEDSLRDGGRPKGCFLDRPIMNMVERGPVPDTLQVGEAPAAAELRFCHPSTLRSVTSGYGFFFLRRYRRRRAAAAANPQTVCYTSAYVYPTNNGATYPQAQQPVIGHYGPTTTGTPVYKNICICNRWWKGEQCQTLSGYSWIFMSGAALGLLLVSLMVFIALRSYRTRKAGQALRPSMVLYPSAYPLDKAGESPLQWSSLSSPLYAARDTRSRSPCVSSLHNCTLHNTTCSASRRLMLKSTKGLLNWPQLLREYPDRQDGKADTDSMSSKNAFPDDDLDTSPPSVSCIEAPSDEAGYTRSLLRYVSAETVAELLRSDQLRSSDEAIYLIDCRYPYEYNGGHILNAINFPPYEMEAMKEFVFNDIASRDRRRAIIILHCEFSQVRAPMATEALKKHSARYGCSRPLELYVMKGGYCDFFRKFKELCEPQTYLEMQQTSAENSDFRFNIEQPGDNLGFHLNRASPPAALARGRRRKVRGRCLDDMDLPYHESRRRSSRLSSSSWGTTTDERDSPIRLLSNDLTWVRPSLHGRDPAVAGWCSEDACSQAASTAATLTSTRMRFGTGRSSVGSVTMDEVCVSDDDENGMDWVRRTS
ncbi:cell division cycle 25 [Perkinsus chesapeaki]|uniref:Cell division cycle 25 n=1 Tax=Perkinsus chesapeaki TaxID=330153 RepID=A0A7J6MSQ2_PERCH|nr:cell division cycle 25 [Perkinsus chesapeaki]